MTFVEFESHCAADLCYLYRSEDRMACAVQVIVIGLHGNENKNHDCGSIRLLSFKAGELWQDFII